MARLGRGQPFKPLIRAARATPNLRPTGIASAETVGTPRFTSQLEVTGIPVATGHTNLLPYTLPFTLGQIWAEMFGVPAVLPSETVEPMGIPTAEAFGVFALNPAIIASGAASGNVFGTFRLDLRIAVSGIATGVAFGTTATQRYIILTTSIGSLEVFGGHYIGVATTIAPTGIPSGTVFGFGPGRTGGQIFDHGTRIPEPQPQVFPDQPDVLAELGELVEPDSPARAAIKAADKLAAAELTTAASSKVVCIMYDKVYKVRGEVGDYIELQAALPRHLVETGTLVLKADDALAWDALKCHEEVVPVTIEVGHLLWSGRIKTARDRFGWPGQGDTVICELEGDRAWLMKIMAWPSFLLPIQAQFPPRGIAFGPAISVIRWLIACQAFRLQAGLWDLVNNLGSLNLDWRSWFGTLLMADVLGPDGHFNFADIVRVLRTPIYVVKTNLMGAIPGVLLDTSPFISVNWRMDKMYDLIDQIVKDNGLVVEVKLWRVGDPQPDENMIYPLTVPTIVVDVKDRMGIVGTTDTFLDGILRTLIDLQDSVFGEITKPFLNPGGEPVPEGFNIAPVLGLHWVPPWVLFLADHPQSGCWGEIAHHHPLAWRTLIGGKSPKWMNDLVNATLSWLLDMVMIVVGLTGVPSNLFEGLFNDLLLAFALADNMDRRIKAGPYGYPEWFVPTGHSPYNIDGIFAMKREQYATRGYVSGIVNFINGYPYDLGRDLFVGSLASVVRRGKVYTDFVEQITITDNRQETKIEVQIGDGVAEEAPVVKTYRNIVRMQEAVNILMLSNST